MSFEALPAGPKLQIVNRVAAALVERHGALPSIMLKNLESFHGRSEDDIERTAKVYAALIVRGDTALRGRLEVQLQDGELAPEVRAIAASALGQAYTQLVARGEAVPSALLDQRLPGRFKSSAMQALARVSAVMIDRGDEVSLKAFDDVLRDEKDDQTLESLGDAYVALDARGAAVPWEMLSLRYDKNDPQAAKVLGKLYAARVKRGVKVSLGKYQVQLGPSASERTVETEKARDLLTPVYEAQAVRGDKAALTMLENWTAAQEGNHSRYALGRVYAESIRQGKPVALQFVEDLFARQPLDAAPALGAAYAALIDRGEHPPIEAQLNHKMKSFAELEFWGPIHQARARRGIANEAALDRLTEIAEADGTFSYWTASILGDTIAALTHAGQMAMSSLDWERYRLWREKRFPYEKITAAKYQTAPDPAQFVAALEDSARTTVRNGFNSALPEERWLAFVGTRIEGIDVSWEEFNTRLDHLMAFDRKNPGSFQRLFEKSSRLSPLRLGASVDGKAAREPSRKVLDRNREELKQIEQRIHRLDWVDALASGKISGISRLYYAVQRQKAIDDGQLRPGERFHVILPAEDEMRQELLQNGRHLYRTGFLLVFNKALGENLRAPALLEVLRDLIVTEILSDSAIRNGLDSADPERRAMTFSNIYGSYKEHLPGSLGISFASIRGLSELITELARDVTQELAKATGGGGDGYNLTPEGFLAVFRGRASNSVSPPSSRR